MKYPYVLWCLIDNKSTLVEIMAWCQTGAKPLPQSWIIQLADAYLSLFASMSKIFSVNTFYLVVFLSKRLWNKYRNEERIVVNLCEILLVIIDSSLFSVLYFIGHHHIESNAYDYHFICYEWCISYKSNLGIPIYVHSLPNIISIFIHLILIFTSYHFTNKKDFNITHNISTI